jgi:hypothetical protein
MLTEEPVLLEDAAIETLSTLEALDDITDTVEAIVLSFGAEPERDAYFAIADEFESFAGSLPEDPALRTREDEARLLELQQEMDEALAVILKDCPDHIRALHGAVRAAVDAEEAARA